MRPAYARARALARRLLDECGVTEPEHICVEAMAALELSWKPPIRVLHARVDGAAAQLVRVGGAATILLSDRVTDPYDRAFLVAHEIGHVVSGHATRSLASLTSGGAHDAESRDQENEANAFASELLMPSTLVSREHDVAVVDLEEARRLARRFSVPLSASAIRITEISPLPCAAICSVKGSIQWYARSRSFAFERRRSLHRATDAYRFHASGSLDGARRSLPAHAWIETASNAEISEQCALAHDPDSVVTMVSIPPLAAGGLSRVTS